MIEWNYAHDADLTIGEKHVSKTAKILLICLIIGLVILSGFAIYFRKYIYDYISNPSIALKESSINIEVHSKFNPKDYIANDTSGFTYEIVNADINTDTLGSYKVIYNSKNRMRKNTTELTVNVVDTTGPEITLLDNIEKMGCTLSLTRGKDTDNFNATTYLKSVTDNLTDSKDIKIDFTTDLDFSKDIVQVIYSATDQQGNVSTKTMNIAVFEDEEVLLAELKKQQEEEERKRQEELKKQQQEQQAQQAQTNTNTNNSNKSSDNSSNKKQSSSTKKESTTEKKKDPYIKGVHNVTVPVDTSPSDIYKKVASGVSGSGYVSIDASSVNPTVPGTYTVYFSSDDGASATCTVTVTEK